MSLFNHVAIYVKDLHKSRLFYEPLLLACFNYHVSHDYGMRQCSPELTSREQYGYVAFRSKDKSIAGDFGIAHEDDKPVGFFHVAFNASSREDVDKFYDEAIKLGATDNGKPGIRANYSPDYYACFVIDPEGNNIEAVYFESGAF